MEKQLKLFFEFLENDKKLSNNTLQSYKRDLKQFRRYIEGCEVAYTKVDEEVMQNYIEYLEELGKKPSTISRCIASIRSFYQYVLKKGKVKKDPTKNLQSPKVEKKAPCVLTSKEVELLLDQPKDVDLKGIRDKAMLEFAYATGMRVTEIISLDIDDIDFKEGFVVKGSDSAEFLRETLSQMGLTPKEYNEFIVYWAPKLQENEYNKIYFAEDDYTDKAKLEINPKPDSILRVFMVYEKADENTVLPKQEIKPFERKGFTVVEWGGYLTE